MHNFATLEGYSPYAALMQASDGTIYGTTFQGGSSGNGTVFSIAADGASALGLKEFDPLRNFREQEKKRVVWQYPSGPPDESKLV